MSDDPADDFAHGPTPSRASIWAAWCVLGVFVAAVVVFAILVITAGQAS